MSGPRPVPGGPRVGVLCQGTCNGCDIEIIAALAQMPDVQVVQPRDANVVLLTGCGTKKGSPAALAEFAKIPQPKVTVQIGACAINDSVFKCGGKRVDGELKVPGCAPSPKGIQEAVRNAAALLKSRK